jgi:hypothetical protein
MLAGGILAATILTLISGAALAEESSDPYRLTPPGLVDEPPRASSQSGAALAAECDAKAAQLVDAERGLTLDTSPPPPLQTLKQIAFLWIGGGILSSIDIMHLPKLEVMIEWANEVGLPLDLALSWTSDPSPPPAFFDLAGGQSENIPSAG